MRGVVCPASNIENTGSLVRKHDGSRAPSVRLGMHYAPSAVRLINETQVEFVCASRGCYLRIAEFFEEIYLAVYTDGGNYRRYGSVDYVLGCMNM